MDSFPYQACDCGPEPEDEESAAGIQFFPPLYIQRYSLALKFLIKYNIKSVIDFGCSECGFFRLLPTVYSLEQVALVDIDKNLLESKKRFIKPEPRHFIFRRALPLHVSLLAGSAEDADVRLQNFEAVTLIEVIEHLYPNILHSVTQNVFGNLRPRLCIVTTPNSEFNVLFENTDPQQFRHWDHKFEWSRQEFQQWCEKVCQQFGYCVKYTGVGTVPSIPDSTHLGPCTQAAIFTLQEQESSGRNLSCVEWKHCYELIAEVDFPYEQDVLTYEEKIDREISYNLRHIVHSQKTALMEVGPLVVSISKLANLRSVKKLCTEDGVRNYLLKNMYNFTSDGLAVIINEDDIPDLDSIHDADSATNEDLANETLDISETSEHESSNGNSQSSTHKSESQEEEDWDADIS